MTEFSPSYHEASHAVAAHTFGVPITYLSVREREDSLGLARLDSDRADIDDVQAAVIMVAGQVGERMALGKDNPQPNWFAEGDHDMEHARHFVHRFFGDDELEGRRQVTFRARSLLRTRWEAVTAIAEKLERNKTVLGEEVSKICLAEAARRGARARAAEPPKPLSQTRTPKRPRGAQSGGKEVRPFTFRVERGTQ
jgi:hypothetical protein